MKGEDLKQPAHPEEPLNIPEEDSNAIPGDDDPFEKTPTYEKPSPGERPSLWLDNRKPLGYM